MKAVILAGGQGIRLGKLSKEIPKPMVKVGDLPILEHQINLLRKYHFKDIIILTNYLSAVIEKHFKDGKDFGVRVSYFREEKPLGTTGGIKEIEEQLTDDFLVLYGDVMLDMNLEKLIGFHKAQKGLCTLTLHPNDHPYDSDLIEIDNNQRIIAFHSKPHQPGRYFRNLVNAAIYVMSPKILRYIKRDKKADFGKDIFPKIVNRERFFGYNTPEYIKDMGTPERLEKVNQDYLSNRIEKFNLQHKRKAIFLDRDGVINYDVGNLSDINDFRILPNSAEAIKFINSSEYLAIITTNQPVIAKGWLGFEGLEEIHKKMETLLGWQGAKLDALYYCPHHPERGFKGEVPGLKIKCDCRKPEPGMIFKAKDGYNIDLAKSWMIGDSERDIEAGINAKIRTMLVKKNQQEFEKCSFKTRKADNLYSAVKSIIKKS